MVKRLTVSLNGRMTNNTSNKLYDIVVEKTKISYWFSHIVLSAITYFIDMVQTPRSIVVLRYSVAYNTIESVLMVFRIEHYHH